MPATANSFVAFTKVSLPFGWLGNMSPYPIEYEGTIYRTAEALFQCTRFEDQAIIEKIRSQKSPMAAKMLAKSHKEKMIVSPCGQQDVENMLWVLMLKLDQHPALCNELALTGNSMIIEDCTKRARSTRAMFWGAAMIEGNWIGENQLGRLWMKLREELRQRETFATG